SAEKVCRDSNDINFLRPGSDGVYFINSVAGDKDKLAVWHLSNDQVLSRISASGINARSRVHEYGGLPYVVHEDHLFVCNLVDQLIYKQPLPGNGQDFVAEPVPLTQIEPDQVGHLRYADFLVDVHRQRLICVREDHRLVDVDDFDARRVVNTLVTIDLETGGEGEVLFAGTDFVSSPSLSPDGKTLAWQTWSHPNMPWDNTEIRLANFDSKGKLTNIRQVQQQSNGSLVQPQFDNKGQLYFIADWSDWWNLYRVTGDELEASCEPAPVYALTADFAPAAWVLGASNYVLLADDSIVVSFTRNGQWELGVIESNAAGQSNLVTIEGGYGQLENLVTIDRQVYFSAATPAMANSIHSLVVPKSLKNNPLAIKKMSITGESPVDSGLISQAEIICFNTADQQIAYGNFYPPANTEFMGSEHSRPPLLVSVHGGPTRAARVSRNFSNSPWRLLPDNARYRFSKSGRWWVAIRLISQVNSSPGNRPAVSGTRSRRRSMMFSNGWLRSSPKPASRTSRLRATRPFIIWRSSSSGPVAADCTASSKALAAAGFLRSNHHNRTPAMIRPATMPTIRVKVLSINNNMAAASKRMRPAEKMPPGALALKELSRACQYAFSLHILPRRSRK
ncbi:MAG: hypothetical protein IIC13_11880, partial [SAR324 cluster bacterium]|nr:hypothetical protein [SAR324 cluster bacterium]